MASLTTNPPPTSPPANPSPADQALVSGVGLRYVQDSTTPGIGRRWVDGQPVYHNPAGRLIDQPAVLERIRALAIPPAWQDVWISPDPQGHLQATGRDARGRKQYRYHAQWHQARAMIKYDRMISFALALPALRRQVTADLSRPGLPREKVVATVVRLLERTHIRVGNDEYRRQNQSFGLTTLHDGHARVNGSTIRFHFRGKSGKEHQVSLRDRRLARIVRRCQELPGHQLFQYQDDEGVQRTIESTDVNAYLRAVAGGDFSAKDFRTWNGTVLAATILAAQPRGATVTERRRQIVQAVKEVAAQLGNTPAVCRACYIHPAVIDAFEADRLPSIPPDEGSADDDGTNLRPAERVVLALLEAASGTAAD